jgi:hypothetical protein
MADEHGKKTHKAFQSVHYSFLAMHNYMRRNVVLKELICTKPCKDIKENIFGMKNKIRFFCGWCKKMLFEKKR